MGRTKKVGTTGRFGPRYGRRVKVMLKKIEAKQRMKHQCPNCKKKTVKRIAAGIWECKSCGLRFAGGAYTPTGEM